jgi:hypothetical protein
VEAHFAGRAAELEAFLADLQKAGENSELAKFFRSADNDQPLTEASLGQRLRAWGALDGTGRSADMVWHQQINTWFALGIASNKSHGIVEFFTVGGRRFARIENDNLIFEYSGFGGNAIMNPNNVTTGLGKFKENWSDINSNGTRQFLGEVSVGLEGLPDGVIARVTSDIPLKNSLAFLDLPETEYNILINNGIKDALQSEFGIGVNVSAITSQSLNDVKNIIRNEIIRGIDESVLDNIVDIGIENGNEVFWISYNKPFLEAAFQRGDDIRLFSDPAVFANSGFYGRELQEINKPGGLAEIYGYTYNSLKKVYKKN